MKTRQKRDQSGLTEDYLGSGEDNSDENNMGSGEENSGEFNIIVHWIYGQQNSDGFNIGSGEDNSGGMSSTSGEDDSNEYNNF